MARPQRVFVAALLFSVLAHVALMSASGPWSILPRANSPISIEAHLVSLTQTAPPSPPPAPARARPVPAPSAAPPIPPMVQDAPQPEPNPTASPAAAPEIATETAAETVPAPPPSLTPPVPAPPAAATAPPFRRELPEHITLRYAVQSGEEGFTLGQATYTWQVRRGHYSLVSVAQATGITALFVSGKIIQTSEGQVTPAGLQPKQFWIAKGERRQAPIQFDWLRQHLRLPSGSVDLPAQTQDLLSFSFHLAMTAREGDAPWSLPVTNGKKLKVYGFHVVGQEVLQRGGAAPVETLHLQGSDTDAGSLDVWLAPNRHWLPVRIRTLDQKGKVMLLDLESSSD